MTTRPASSETIVTATELRRNFKSVVKRLRKTRKPAVIQSKGEAVAIMLSVEEYKRLTEAETRRKALEAHKEFSRAFGREIERLGITEEEFLAELDKTRKEIFEERYGRRT